MGIFIGGNFLGGGNFHGALIATYIALFLPYTNNFFLYV